MKENKRPEVLAPAGSLESIYAAVRCGADGIYVGGKDFSARANAVNFSDDELAFAVRYCHLHGVKIYRAMNTVIFDSEAEEFVRQVKFSAKLGVDGLIIQDTGAAMLARLAVKNMPLHASTQMTVHTPMGAEFIKKLGFCRVVPARELTLEAIKDICDTGIETEVFVHGAQCMCLSGQCYMSAFIGGRSANRGQCAQACRLPFSAEGKKEYYALSLKDMSLAAHIAKLSKAGCSSFKIEGRMKRPEYVAAAVTAFRHGVDGEDISQDLPRLEAVFSRSGFTDGYLTGKTGKEMFGSRRKEDVVSAENVLPELAKLYKDEKKSGSIDFYFTVKKDMAELSFETDGISGKIQGSIPEKALKRSLSEEDAAKQLSKLGGSRYTLGKMDISIEEGVTLPASEINRMRREALLKADGLTIEKNTPKYDINESFFLKKIKSEKAFAPLDFRIRTENPEVISALFQKAELFILPFDKCEKAADFAEKTAAELPDIVTDEKELYRQLEAIFQKGFSRFVCQNLTHMGVLSALKEKYDIIIHGGTGLNITNSFAAKSFAQMGLCDITVSPELKAAQISAMEKPIPTGFYAYGNFPLMTVKNCPVKAQTGCKNCTGGITDRTGRFFPVKCCKNYARILNCQPTETSDKLSAFTGVSFALLDIGDMHPKQAENILYRYLHKIKPEGNFTRGLYFRGLSG